MSADYGYRGVMAESWDLLRKDTSGWLDAAWFRTVVEQGAGPALDVGCGTGRTLIEFLARGLDVDGLDNSPEVLALCHAKGEAAGFDMAGRLHRGEMQTLDLPRRYATVYVPSTSIQLLTDPADLDRASPPSTGTWKPWTAPPRPASPTYAPTAATASTPPRPRTNASS